MRRGMCSVRQLPGSCSRKTGMHWDLHRVQQSPATAQGQLPKRITQTPQNPNIPVERGLKQQLPCSS